MAARDSSGGKPGAQAAPPNSGGPGEWVKANEGMPEQARRYQAQVTGAPEGYVYRVKLVEFFEGRKQMLEQAQRQLRAARGTPIRWIVAEEKLSGALRKMFKAERLEIEVVHVSPTPPTP
jgi:hypothetical protein